MVLLFPWLHAFLGNHNNCVLVADRSSVRVAIHIVTPLWERQKGELFGPTADRPTIALHWGANSNTFIAKKHLTPAQDFGRGGTQTQKIIILEGVPKSQFGLKIPPPHPVAANYSRVIGPGATTHHVSFHPPPVRRKLCKNSEFQPSMLGLVRRVVKIQWTEWIWSRVTVAIHL